MVTHDATWAAYAPRQVVFRDGRIVADEQDGRPMTLSLTTPLALAALLRNKMRSLLTTLGIVIGVAAVVMMQSMGEGATAYVGEAISGLGSNMLIRCTGRDTRVWAADDRRAALHDDRRRRRSPASARRRPTGAASTRACSAPSPARTIATSTSAASRRSTSTSANGASRAVGCLDPEDDRQAAQVCVIGQTVRDALFAGQNPIGKELRVRDLACRVVGVLEAKGASAFGMDQDDVVFMPFSTFSRRIVGNDRVATHHGLGRVDGPDRRREAGNHGRVCTSDGTSCPGRTTTSPCAIRARSRPCCRR